MKSKTVTARLPIALEQEIGSLAQREHVQKTVLVRELLVAGLQERRQEHALKLYAEGKVTLWRAAELAGLSLWEMLDLVKERKISLLYTVEDVQEDARRVREHL